MATEFAHLHLHTDFSFLDGACQIDKLAALAVAQGFPALAITDHGNMHGVFDFYQALRKTPVKPILGCEFYQAPGQRTDKSPSNPNCKGFHLILLARDAEGYRNLCRLNALAHLEGFYYHPRIDKDALAQHAAGLYGTSACIGSEIDHYVLANDLPRARQALDDFLQILGRDNFALELQDHGLPEQKRCNRELIKLAKEFGVPLVATNDAHYLTRAHAKPHDILLCIGTGKTLNDTDRLRFPSAEFYVKSGDEMAALFAEVPEALRNTLLVAERCAVKLDTGTSHYPVFVPPDGSDRDAYLAARCRQGLVDRYGVDLERTPRAQLDERARGIVERLEYELGVIKTMGFTSYFLVVWDFIEFARRQGVPVGPGRGSGAGSIVAYLLHITDLDPLRYGLLFERFLNPDRVSPPDFDIDFCERRRAEVIEYVRGKYGADHVAQICTYGTLKTKAVLKDVARVLGRSFEDSNRLTKLVPSAPNANFTLQTALQLSAELQQARQNEPWIAEVVANAEPLEGMNRQPGIHAAGVIIGDQVLTNLVPLGRGANDEVITQYEAKPCEKLGLLKMDFLGLKTLTVIQDTCDFIKKTRGVSLTPAQIPLDDPSTYELLRRSETVCVFQLESGGMQNLFRRAQVERIEDVIALIALYRPGPMNYIDDFLDRKCGRVHFAYDVPALEKVLQETYGVMVYQEQVMQVVQVVAGFSLAAADLLRRAMGKKDQAEMEAQHARFVEGARGKGYGQDVAQQLWDKIAKFAEYGFNKSHSAAYAVLAVQTAYLKAHYPVEFMCANLTSEIDDAKRLAELIAECRTMGIAMLPPAINVSDQSFTVDGRAIRFGLAAIKGCGVAAANAIIAARTAGGPFQSLDDLCERVGAAANRRLLESLVKCGALDAFKQRRAQLCERLDEAVRRAQATVRDREAGQGNLFDLLGAGPMAPAAGPEVPEWSHEELLNFEKELLNFYITGHPLDLHQELVSLYRTQPVARVAGLADDVGVRLGGRVAAVAKKVAKRDGRTWAILTLEDLEAAVDCLVFADAYAQCADLIQENALLFVEGHVSRREGEDRPQVIVTRLVSFAKAEEVFTREVLVTVRETEAAEGGLAALGALLRGHPGRTPVLLSLVLRSGEYACIETGSRFHVQFDAALAAELRRHLGADAVRLKKQEKVAPRERRRWEERAPA